MFSQDVEFSTKALCNSPYLVIPILAWRSLLFYCVSHPMLVSAETIVSQDKPDSHTFSGTFAGIRPREACES